MYEAMDVDKDEVSTSVCETGIGQYDPAVVSSRLRECDTVRSSLDHVDINFLIEDGHIYHNQGNFVPRLPRLKENYIIRIKKENLEVISSNELIRFFQRELNPRKLEVNNHYQIKRFFSTGHRRN
ncbi:hypothetical protein ACOME3_004700 [Neoechinorhynchus agilis]